jgi:hypothetical protein
MKENYRPGFIYTIENIAADGRIKSVETEHNLMPGVALDYLLNAGFKDGAQYSTFYLSVFTANYTPLAADTMTTFIASCSEDTSYTTSGTNRLTITFPAVVGGALTTSASPNEFSYTGSATIRGGFITTGLTRGATAGLLVSAVLFPSAKVLAAGESLRVPIGFALVSA